MQNNVTDLSQKLQRSLDNNYNVVDMPAVIEIISALEKTSVTKELLETTRLARYINELRRRTSNEPLAKRAKDLLKKWRGLILPESNGQVRTGTNTTDRSDNPDSTTLNTRKRSARDPKTDSKQPPIKRPILNGQSRELDFSDNSNCSIKDVKKIDVIFINSDSNSSMPDQSLDSVGSHSTNDTSNFDEYANAQPKKRGRKKGSKNHTNLVLAAEESFSNKMAMSKNSKVKTTQELLADLQNRTTTKQSQDIELRAAQLTESLSRIDQKLNPQKVGKGVVGVKGEKAGCKPVVSAVKNIKTEPIATIKQEKTSGVAGEHWSLGRTTPEIVILQSDDEIVDVCGTDSNSPSIKPPPASDTTTTTTTYNSQTIEDIIRQLPPINITEAEEADEIPDCVCPLPQIEATDKITVEIVGETEEKPDFTAPLLSFNTQTDLSDSEPKPEPQPPDQCCEISDTCPARLYLRKKYDLDAISDTKVMRFQTDCLPNINGNWGLCMNSSDAPLYDNIVPNMSTERIRKDLTFKNAMSPASENYNKYSISINDTTNVTQLSTECDSERTAEATDSTENNSDVKREFREWHETVDVNSYNGEILRILPYVIID